MSHESETIRKAPVPWPLYGLFAIAALLIVAAMAYVFQQVRDINETHDPLLLHLADAELSATQAHLWFEEMLSGDREATIEQVVGLLDEVETTLHILSGKPPPSDSHPPGDALRKQPERVEIQDGTPPNESGFFHLSHESHALAAITEAVSNVDHRFDVLREVLAERYRASRTSGPGTKIDQRFDRVFAEFLEATADTKHRVRESKQQHMADFRTVQVSVIGFSLALTGAVLLVFVRFERRKAVNLTALANSESTLRRSEGRFRALAQAAPVGIFRTDAAGQYLYANERWSEFTGIPAEEALGESWTLALHPEERERVLAEWHDALGQETPFHAEYRIRPGDGEDTWVVCRARSESGPDGKIAGWVGTLTDITHRKRAEQALEWELRIDRARAELAHTLVDPDQHIEAVAHKVLACARELTGSEHGYVSEIDRGTGENVAHTLTAMMGNTCQVTGPDRRFVFPLDDDGRHPKLWGHALDTGEPFFTNSPQDHPMGGLPEGHVPLERFLSTPVSFGGEVVGQIALANPSGDYSELHLRAVQQLSDLYALAIHRHRSEEDRLRLEGQVHQAQKMEAVGTLAGGIAHDFNNILGAILGYSELALLEVSDGSKLARDLEEVVRAGQRARELVKQILTFSRKGDQTRRAVQTHLAVGEALRLLRQTIPTSIPIVSDIRKKDNTVLIDPTQLHQIVMNLCTNAYHAMRARGGTLSVTLEPIDVSSALADTVPGLKMGPYVKLTVSDTGDGMTPETLARVFEPFFTTKDQGEGTGMGLPVVYGIVSGLEGAIAVESRSGEGTRIDVYLPRHLGESTPPAQEQSDAPGGTERILVVDDEPALAKVVRKILTSLGYEVESVTTSEKALATFLEDPARFDLVVTDQTMPGMTGAVLARKMLDRRPDLPIVICTGYSESLDEAAALKVGVKAFLHKPLERSSLAKTLRAVLAT